MRRGSAGGFATGRHPVLDLPDCQRDRSRRKLAHRGSYLERVWVAEPTVRKVHSEDGLVLAGNAPREPIPRAPWPDWLERKPNRVWG